MIKEQEALKKRFPRLLHDPRPRLHRPRPRQHPLSSSGNRLP